MGFAGLRVLVIRHPEVRAERASKDAAEASGSSPFKGRFAATFRVTGQGHRPLTDKASHP
jgi:hypothetical protein